MGEVSKQLYDDVVLARERLLLAEEAASLGVWEWQIDTDTSVWSPGNYRLFNLPPNARASYGIIRPLVHPDDLERLDREVRDSIHTGHFRSEYRVLQPDGSLRWLMSMGRVAKDEQGKPRRMMGVNIDVTARHQAEEASRRAAEAEAVGRMAGALAHQINNPLAALTNSLFLLRQQTAYDDRVEAVVQMAEEALSRVTSITRHLLSLYADERAWKPAGFAESVEEVVSFHQNDAFARSLKLSHRTNVNSGALAPRPFRGLLSALILDAIESSRRDGEVRICVSELRSRSTRMVRVGLAQHASNPPQQEALFPELAGKTIDRIGGIHLWTALAALKQLDGKMRLRGHGATRLRGLSVTFPLNLYSAIESAA